MQVLPPFFYTYMYSKKLKSNSIPRMLHNWVSTLYGSRIRKKKKDE